MNNRVGYWHGTPLSVGRFIEDVLALAWRVRRRIAPVLIVLAAGTAIVDIAEPPSTWMAPPQLPPITTALYPTMPPMPTHFPTTTVVWNLFSLLLIVALTKVLYLSYYEHEDVRSSQMKGLVRGGLRMIAAMVCYLLAAIVFLVPVLFFYGMLSFFAMSGLIAAGGLLFAAVSVLLFAVIVLGVVLFMLIIMGGQYISVGSIIRPVGIFQVVGEGLRSVFLPKYLRRTIALGCSFVGILLVLSYITKLIGHISEKLVPNANALVITDVVSIFTLTPILAAFAVVFFTDANRRLELEREATHVYIDAP